MTDAVRAFVAIELPEHIRAGLAQVQAKLRPRFTIVKWVELEGIHLTLKFLGNVTLDQLEALGHALSEAAARSRPHEVAVRHVGGFPNLTAPRVLWIGLEAPEDLAQLQGAVEDVTAPLGFPKEDRAFTPHLTLGRVREGVRGEGKRHLGEAAQTLSAEDLGSFRVAELSLMRSTLTPQGAIYTRLRGFPLGRDQHI